MSKKDEQKEAIDEWMLNSGFPVLDLQQIEVLFGGFGENRPRKLEDLETRPNSAAAKWFNSGQTYYEYYQMPQYIYDNWWCAWNVSNQTYSAAARFALEKGFDTVIDVGGSIFAAELFRDMSGGQLECYNIDNFRHTLNASFAYYYNMSHHYGHLIDAWGPCNGLFSEMLIMAEYLEHFYDVDEEFTRWTRYDNMVIANGFCVTAYGHYVPIKINGVEHTTRASADAAFLGIAQNAGYTVSKVPYITKDVLILERKKNGS